MSKSERKFVDMVTRKAMDNKATRPELERASVLLDDSIKGRNPKLYKAMLESRKLGF